MTDAPPAQNGRPRPWLADALVGAGLAASLITVANAALPRLEHSPPPTRARLAKRPPAPPRPPAAPVLIAFQEPLPGYPVISPFGLRRLPWEPGPRLHAGVDVAAPTGLPVLAAADGVVTRMTTDPGYGRFVEIKHAAGLSTIYAHLSRFLPRIAPGVAVKAGRPVGEIGSTGSSTGAHLHFEVRDDNDRPLNPAMFLGRSFAETRELPLRAAERIPRGVRVAYVSVIPKARRQEMQARLEAEAAAAAAEAGSDRAEYAANADGAGIDASARAARFVGIGADGRPHARFRMRN